MTLKQKYKEWLESQPIDFSLSFREFGEKAFTAGHVYGLDLAAEVVRTEKRLEANLREFKILNDVENRIRAL